MPCAPVLRKAPRADFDFLDFEEAERLFDATVPEYLPMVATALKAGLRLGELLALRQTDVDLVNGQIFVKRSVWKKDPRHSQEWALSTGADSAESGSFDLEARRIA